MKRMDWLRGVQWLLGLALMLTGAWMASQGGQWYQQRSQNQTAAAALPQLSDEIRLLLSNAQHGLILSASPDLQSGEQLKLLLQELQREFPFLTELELRDGEARLLKTTLAGTDAAGSLLDPGRAALHETALNSGTALYSSIYQKTLRQHADFLVDLFVPIKKLQAQSIIATVSVTALLRQAKEQVGPQVLTGLDAFIVETTDPGALAQRTGLSEARLALEHQGLRLSLGAAVVGEPQARLMRGMRWLAALLGAAAVLLLMLWAHTARLRKEARSRYAQLEKKVNADARIAALGEMSTTIAHELNHPLGAISNYAYSLEKMARDKRLEPVFLEGVAQIRVEAARGAEVIKSIRDFLRRDAGDGQFIDVHELLEEMRPLLLIQGQSLDCKMSIESSPGLRVMCPKTLLQQAILNLSRNGLEAMQDVPRHKRLLQIRASKDPQSGRVTLAVLDTGPGLSQDAQQSLFKPFFTTKKDGLGIGLSLCQSIAERHNGILRWKNNLHGGACFELDFPAQANSRGAA